MDGISVGEMGDAVGGADLGEWREIRSLVSDVLSWKYLLGSRGEILKKAV